jgi:hypothetical protein
MSVPKKHYEDFPKLPCLQSLKRTASRDVPLIWPEDRRKKLVLRFGEVIKPASDTDAHGLPPWSRRDMVLKTFVDMLDNLKR